MGEQVNGCFDAGPRLPLGGAKPAQGPEKQSRFFLECEGSASRSILGRSCRGEGGGGERPRYALEVSRGRPGCAFFSHFLALPLGPYIAIWAPGALGLTAPGSHGPWAPRAPSVQRSGMRFFLQCEGSTSWCILGWTWGDGSGSTDVLTGPGLSVGGPLCAKVPENQIG